MMTGDRELRRLPWLARSAKPADVGFAGDGVAAEDPPPAVLDGRPDRTVLLRVTRLTDVNAETTDDD